MKKRVQWIDICKAFGMFFIFLGHFGEGAGLAYPWVFSFHVPLFFFLSGLLENYNKRTFFDNLRQKSRTILLPFFFFGIGMICVKAVETNSLTGVGGNLLALLKGGIRNTCVMNQGLWFLTCLFVMGILFSVIRKLRLKPVILLVCLVLFLVTELCMGEKPSVAPRWYWNLDSACTYMIYYGLGWAVYEPLNRLLEAESGREIWIRRGLTLVSLVFSAQLFFGKNLMAGLAGYHILLGELLVLMTPLFTIYLIIVISCGLSKVEWIQEAGRSSLYLCGNESFARLLLQTVLSAVGLTFTVGSPLQAYLWSGVQMVLIVKVLVPLEKPLLEKLQKLC